MSIAILQQMIRIDATLALTNIYEKHAVHLTEPQQPDSQVTIKGIPEGTIIIKVDTFPAPDKIFTGTKGECKRADYVIISANNNKKRVLFIEMKRTKDLESKIIAQFKGATCFIEYCKEIAKQFYDCNDFLEGYEYRYISFGHTSIQKQKTRIERTAKVHNAPECMLKMHWPGIQWFDHIAS